MNVLRGFRYRFYPTPEQESALRRTIGCVRLVYNKALAERSQAWTSGKKSISYAAQSRSLTAWKQEPELAFLNDVSCVPTQQALRHLQAAYSNFFAKRAAYPSFKRKGNGGSAEYTRSAFRLIDGEVHLAKMDAPLNVCWSRPLPKNAQPSTVTTSLDAAGRWHISLLCEDVSVRPLLKLKTAVGIDAGISAFATLSTGEKIANPRFDERLAERKKFLSRSLSRKVRGSSNRNKAKLKLSRLHARVADRRKDFLSKLSTRLVRENQAIVVEDLNVKGMLQNHRLARVISDVGWSEFFRQLEYKCHWYGRTLVKVDRFFPSSKTCSACGCGVEKLPLDVRRWTCPACKAEHDRDENAARNILAAGLAVSACGPIVSQRILRGAVQMGLKQEVSPRKSGILAL